MNIFKTLQDLWNRSSEFRHSVTAFLSVQLAVPIVQIGSWAQSKGATALPNWQSVLTDLGYAIIAALIAAYLKWQQNKKAFPPQSANSPSPEPPQA